MRRLVTLVLVLAPVMVMAQEPRFEVVPTLYYRWGGSIVVDDQALNLSSFDVNVGDAGGYGFLVALRMNDRLRLDLTLSHQDTKLEDDQGLFGEEPGWVVPPGTSTILSTDITYVHLGATWDLTEGPNRWFLGGSAGVTHFDFTSPLGDHNRLSLSGLAGVQVELNHRLSLRFAARVYWTDTDPGTTRTQFVEHPDCASSCAYVYGFDDNFFQTELSIGLAISL